MIYYRIYYGNYSYILVTVLVVLLILTSGCVTQKHSDIPDSVKVGILYPLTGDSSGFGIDCMNGTLLAIEEINNAGGISSLQGARLIPVMGDTKGIQSIGSAETERLIRGEKGLCL